MLMASVPSTRPSLSLSTVARSVGARAVGDTTDTRISPWCSPRSLERCGTWPTMTASRSPQFSCYDVQDNQSSPATILTHRKAARIIPIRTPRRRPRTLESESSSLRSLAGQGSAGPYQASVLSGLTDRNPFFMVRTYQQFKASTIHNLIAILSFKNHLQFFAERCRRGSTTCSCTGPMAHQSARLRRRLPDQAPMAAGQSPAGHRCSASGPAKPS